MLVDVFNCMAIFQNLSPTQKELLRPLFISIQEPMGTLLFEQGDPAQYLYLVVDGEVNIRYKPEDGPALIVARIRSGGVVGWSAALGNLVYTSAAICAADCHLLRVQSQDLRDLCEQYPDTGSMILERLAAAVAQRVSNAQSHVIALLEQGMRKPAEAG